MFMLNKNYKEEGQLMIIMAVLMGGLFLVGTAIAGLLMYFSVSQSSDVISSNAAIFAADAGIEKALRCYFYEKTIDPKEVCKPESNTICQQSETLSNGASYNSYVQFTSCEGNDPTGFKVKSVGKAAKAERVLEQFFDLK